MYATFTDYHSLVKKEYPTSLQLDREDEVCSIEYLDSRQEEEDLDNMEAYDDLLITHSSIPVSTSFSPPPLEEDELQITPRRKSVTFHEKVVTDTKIIPSRIQLKQENSYPEIPFVIIAYNNLTFVKNFVDQLRRYPHRIIIFDNASAYPPMKVYYDQIEQELGSKITIHRLKDNYGHNVYQQQLHLLPKQFMLSDPDLQLHPDMPMDVDQILLKISREQYAHKVGAALDLSDAKDFIDCPNYSHGKGIAQFEKQYWNMKIPHPTYELYRANLDTTFCLVNTEIQAGSGVRVAGNFTAKHLPWYKEYIKKNVPKQEIDYWKQNNKSSSILFTCLKL